MAKVQIKSEKLTPFGGIFSIMEQFDSMLSPIIEPIPTWALCYLINGDPTGLTDDEIAMIDKWYADNKVQTVTTASEAEGECHPYFSHFPAFGLPAEVTDCHVMTL
jgi:hypothetical protein